MFPEQIGKYHPLINNTNNYLKSSFYTIYNLAEKMTSEKFKNVRNNNLYKYYFFIFLLYVILMLILILELKIQILKYLII